MNKSVNVWIKHWFFHKKTFHFSTKSPLNITSSNDHPRQTGKFVVFLKICVYFSDDFFYRNNFLLPIHISSFYLWQNSQHMKDCWTNRRIKLNFAVATKHVCYLVLSWWRCNLFLIECINFFFKLSLGWSNESNGGWLLRQLLDQFWVNVTLILGMPLSMPSDHYAFSFHELEYFQSPLAKHYIVLSSFSFDWVMVFSTINIGFTGYQTLFRLRSLLSIRL